MPNVFSPGANRDHYGCTIRVLLGTSTPRPRGLVPMGSRGAFKGSNGQMRIDADVINSKSVPDGSDVYPDGIPREAAPEPRHPSQQ